MGQVRKGSGCLFFLYSFSNFLLLLVGVGIIAGGIELFIVLKMANIFNILVVSVGILLLLLSGCGFALRRSQCGLKSYNILLLILLASMILITIFMLFKRDMVIDWAVDNFSGTEEEKAKFRELVSGNVDIGNYILMACSLILVSFILKLQLFCFVFGLWYLGSVNKNTHNYNEKLLTKNRYEKSVQDIEDVVSKNQDKRYSYMQKYPELAQKNLIN